MPGEDSCGPNCTCGQSCASRVPIFQDLNPQELARFDHLLTTREFAGGEIIYHQDSPASVFCLVNSGGVKIFKTSPEGREQVLRLLGSGDFFGEAVLFGEHARSASAQALGPTKICLLDKGAAEEVVQSHPEIARKLIAALNLRLQTAEEQIENLGTRTSLQRVARLLADLAAEQAADTVALPLSREGLASLTGMTVENFSRKLGELQDQGLITPQGRKKIVIRDLARLRELA